MTENVFNGDCLHVLDSIERESIDLVYVDPPFFTQSIHQMKTYDGAQEFKFSDIWKDSDSYFEFIFQRLIKIYDKIKPTGSLFFHCDKNASHIVRFILEQIFGTENFQSEIIWSYRRWSNSKRGLLNSHQTIYFFSKSSSFKFFPFYENYSPSTNIEQIMQKRKRDERNKTIYARQDNGEIIGNGAKKGVPIGDVWDIPFLNPKAKERVNYPTQKPVILLKRIIELTTSPGDTVLDPFCGSGTTLVASQVLNRISIGIDISSQAVELTRKRLQESIVTRSALLENGRSSYKTYDSNVEIYLSDIDYIPVYRNKGIDGLLKDEIGNLPVFLRIQRPFETQDQAAQTLIKASKNKGKCFLIVIITKNDLIEHGEYPGLAFIKSTRFKIEELRESITLKIKESSEIN